MKGCVRLFRKRAIEDAGTLAVSSRPVSDLTRRSRLGEGRRGGLVLLGRFQQIKENRTTMGAATLPTSDVRLTAAQQSAIARHQRSPLPISRQDQIIVRLCDELNVDPLHIIGYPSKLDARGWPKSLGRWTILRAMVVMSLRAAGLSYPQIGVLLHRDHSTIIHLKAVLDDRIARALPLRLAVERLQAIAVEMAGGQPDPGIGQVVGDETAPMVVEGAE